MKLNYNQYQIDQNQFQHFLMYNDHRDLINMLYMMFVVYIVVANLVIEFFHNLVRMILLFDHIPYPIDIHLIYLML